MKHTHEDEPNPMFAEGSWRNVDEHEDEAWATLTMQARAIVTNARRDWGPSINPFAEVAHRMDVSNDIVLYLLETIDEEDEHARRMAVISSRRKFDLYL